LVIISVNLICELAESSKICTSNGVNADTLLTKETASFGLTLLNLMQQRQCTETHLRLMKFVTPRFIHQPCKRTPRNKKTSALWRRFVRNSFYFSEFFGDAPLIHHLNAAFFTREATSVCNIFTKLAHFYRSLDCFE